jgi:hypothetical protein
VVETVFGHSPAVPEGTDALTRLPGFPERSPTLKFQPMRRQPITAYCSSIFSRVDHLKGKKPLVKTVVVILVADAHRDRGKRFVGRADEKLTAFLELESATRAYGELS